MAEPIINPCWKCSSRCIGCHGQCEKYKNWKKQHDEHRKIVMNQKNEEYAYYVEMGKLNYRR